MLAAKLVSLAVLGAGSVIAGCIPMAALAFVRRGKRGRDATLNITADSPLFSYSLCFGAGVLLSTLLCHMIPESLESWEDLQANGLVAENDVPLPSILTGVGFFLVYFVEELAHRIMHGRQKSQSKVTPETTEMAELSATELQRQHDHAGAAGHSHGVQEGHSHGAALAETSDSALVTFLLLIALSVHAILEGIAIGAEPSREYVYIMLAAVCSHKFILVFILGLELLTTNLRPLAQFGCVMTFVLATELGIGIGIGVFELEADGRAHDVSLMVMQTLSSGTIMFVCFMEVMNRERGRKGHKMAQLASMVVGFALIAVLVSLVTEPEED